MKQKHFYLILIPRLDWEIFRKRKIIGLFLGSFFLSTCLWSKSKNIKCWSRRNSCWRKISSRCTNTTFLYQWNWRRYLNQNFKFLNIYLDFFLNKENPQSREDLIWDANGGLTEKQIEQYLIVARYFLTFDFYIFNLIY